MVSLNRCATFVFLLVSALSYGQTRLIMNDSIFVRLDAGTFLVLDNSATNAITLLGTQKGKIISEDEDNKVRWNLGTSTGVYQLPFADTTNFYSIPVECNITTAGTGSGRIDFSTYRTVLASLNINNAPWPSMVTNIDFLSPFPSAGADVLFTVDRFWIVDAFNYTVKPSVTMAFSYANIEAAATNTITEASLQAYRFNDGIGEWEGTTKQFGSQVTGSPVAKVTNVVVSPSDLFAAWTLADKSIALPIELQNFRVFCKNGNQEIRWETASENENDYFEVQKSANGLNFDIIGKVDGVGNSTNLTNYSFKDQVTRTDSYYRLKQVDFDSEFTYSDVVFSSTCTESDLALRIFPNPSSGFFTLLFDALKKNVEYTVSDIYGKQVMMNKISNTQEIQLNLDKYDAGVYFLSIKADGENDLRRLVKK